MVVEEVEGFDISIFLGEGGRVGQLERWGRLGLVGLQWWGGSCQGSRVGVLGAGGEEVGGGEYKLFRRRFGVGFERFKSFCEATREWDITLVSRWS